MRVGRVYRQPCCHAPLHSPQAFQRQCVGFNVSPVCTCEHADSKPAWWGLQIFTNLAIATQHAHQLTPHQIHCCIPLSHTVSVVLNSEQLNNHWEGMPSHQFTFQPPSGVVTLEKCKQELLFWYFYSVYVDDSSVPIHKGVNSFTRAVLNHLFHHKLKITPIKTISTVYQKIFI